MVRTLPDSKIIQDLPAVIPTLCNENFDQSTQNLHLGVSTKVHIDTLLK